MVDHLYNCDETDTDSRPRIIQKQCWMCFKLFVASVSTEVRCPKCLKKMADDFDAPHKIHVSVKGENIPEAKLECIPEIPDDRSKIRIESATPENSENIVSIAKSKIAVVRMDWIALRALAPLKIKIGNTHLDFSKCQMMRKGKVIRATKNEWRLLALLCSQPGHVIPRFILSTQTGYEHNGRSIDTLKAVINKKIDHKIKTLTGIGYYLEVDHE